MDEYGRGSVVILATLPQNIVPGLFAPVADRKTTEMHPDTEAVARQPRVLGVHPRLPPCPLRLRLPLTRTSTRR